MSLYAIETNGSVTFRVGLRKSPGWLPRFPAYEGPARPTRAVFATTGIPIGDDGDNHWLDIGLATRRALVELIGWLRAERGYGFEQALALASVACELRISQAVDVPNPLVSAALPLDVFDAITSPSAAGDDSIRPRRSRRAPSENDTSPAGRLTPPPSASPSRVGSGLGEPRSAGDAGKPRRFVKPRQSVGRDRLARVLWAGGITGPRGATDSWPHAGTRRVSAAAPCRAALRWAQRIPSVDVVAWPR